MPKENLFFILCNHALNTDLKNLQHNISKQQKLHIKSAEAMQHE